MVSEQGAQPKALDFAGDTPHGEILPLLQEALGGYAQQTQQAAAADAAAAATDQPPPQLSGPGTIGTDTNALYTPQVPGDQMASTQGPGPQGAPQSGAQVTQEGQVPPPTVGPQRGPQLSPQSLNNAAETEQAQAQSDMQNAAALKVQAAQAKRDLDEQTAKEQQPFLDQEVQLAQAKVAATDQVNNFLTNAQQQILADTDSDIQQATTLAKEKPEEWFANRDTGQRISAVVGMIGAGLAGRNVAGYVDNIINKDIAAHNRKEANLAQLHQLHNQRYNMKRQMYNDASSSIETRYIASMKLVASQMEAKANQSSNAKVKANYQAAVAEIYTKLSDDTAKLVNQRLGKRIDEESNAIKWAQLGIERQRMNQVKTPNDDSVPFDVAEQTIPGGKQGVPKNVSVGVKKDVDLKVDALNTAQALREQIQTFEQGGTSLAQAISQSAPLRNYLLATARKFSGVGANLTGNEKDQMEGLALTLTDIAKGYVTGASWEGKLQAVENQFAQSIRQQVTSNTPGLHIRKDSAPGRVFARQEKKTAQEQAEVQQVQKALQGKSPTAQNATLKMLATNGNKVAKNIIKENEVKDWIGRAKQMFGIGQDKDE